VIDGCELVFFRGGFCDSIGAVSSSINRLLLLLFHASLPCCMSHALVYSPLPLLLFCITFRCFLVRDYAYDHYAYMYINTIVSLRHLQLSGAVLDGSWDPSR